MVKNDFLLRALLFFGCFWLFKLGLEFVSLFFGWFYFKTNWFSIIGAGILSYLLAPRVFITISHSVSERNKLSSTVRWLLYLLIGYGFYISILKIVELAFFDQWGFWHSFNTIETLVRVKLILWMVAAFLVASYLTRVLVSQIGFTGDHSSSAKAVNKGNSNTSPTKQFKREKNDKDTTHGSSAFSDFDNFNQKHNALSNYEMKRRFDDVGGYVISPNTTKYVEISHAVTIAGTRQGKGTTAIIPNLLSYSKDNWVVLDVRGENAAVTARYHQETKQNVYILDPFGVQKAINVTHTIPASGFNPLMISKYLPEEEITDFASMIAEMLVPEAESTNSSDGYWPDSARNAIKTYILHLITDKDIDDADRHLGKLYEWLRLDHEAEAALWIDMKHNPYTKFGANELISVASSADKTWGSIQSHARKSTAFLDSPLIQRSLRSNDFDPMELQTTATSVFVILPERSLGTQKTWLRLVFGSILKLCYFVAKRRVNFLLDEFPILGRMDDFLRAYAFGLGQKISCWIFAQSLSQIKQIYGEDGLNTILSNSRIKQFFGVNDLYSQTYISDLLGFTTEIIKVSNQNSNSGSSENRSSDLFRNNASKSSGNNFGQSSGVSEQVIQRKLMLPDEVGNLEHEFLLMIDGNKYRVEKIRYYNGDNYKGRFDPNPYVHR